MSSVLVKQHQHAFSSTWTVNQSIKSDSQLNNLSILSTWPSHKQHVGQTAPEGLLQHLNCQSVDQIRHSQLNQIVYCLTASQSIKSDRQLNNLLIFSIIRWPSIPPSFCHIGTPSILSFPHIHPLPVQSTMGPGTHLASKCCSGALDFFFLHKACKYLAFITSGPL